MAQHLFLRRDYAVTSLLAIGVAFFSCDAAAAKGGGWKDCRSPDADSRIAGCTEIIDNLAKEPLHNKIAAYVNRGGALQAKGEFDRAVSDFDKALELSPKNPLILNARAGAYRAKGDLEKAIADYSVAIEAQPKDASAYSGRAGAYLAKSDFDRALADFDKAIGIDGKFAAAYVGRARVQKAKGDLEKALSDFKRSGAPRPEIAARVSWSGVDLSGQRRMGSRDCGLRRSDQTRAEERRLLE